jgi:hypothetical protein
LASESVYVPPPNMNGFFLMPWAPTSVTNVSGTQPEISKTRKNEWVNAPIWALARATPDEELYGSQLFYCGSLCSLGAVSYQTVKAIRSACLVWYLRPAQSAANLNTPQVFGEVHTPLKGKATSWRSLYAAPC